MNSQWCNHMWHGHKGVMAHGSWQYDLPTSGSIVWPLAIPPELNKSAWFHALTDRTKEAGVPLRFVKPCGAFCVCFCQGGSVEFCEALCFFFRVCFCQGGGLCQRWPDEGWPTHQLCRCLPFGQQVQCWHDLFANCPAQKPSVVLLQRSSDSRKRGPCNSGPFSRGWFAERTRSSRVVFPGSCRKFASSHDIVNFCFSFFGFSSFFQWYDIYIIYIIEKI